VQVPPTALRVVSLGCGVPDREELRRELAGEGISTRLGRYAPCALVVESGSIQSSRAFREGRVVIQDEASQLVAELLTPRAGQRVLDLCAAPGLKAGQLAQMLGQGILVACDLSASRLRTLAKLLPAQLPPEVRLLLIRLDATQPLPFGIRFDRILLDVPCSGTGTLSRNPEIKWRLQARDFARLAEAQGRMLRQALKVLAPGGRLIYATCSLEPEENEQVVEKVLEEVQGYRTLTRAELAREFPAQAPLFDSCGYFRTRPDLHRTDGFFAAVITRTT
jgi:16S rRNA (cytosine967-C5)-methyltransferase